MNNEPDKPQTGYAKHVLLTPLTCPCDKTSDTPCNVCDGGLAICAACGKAEIELDDPVCRAKATEDSIAMAQAARCDIYLNGKVRCRLPASHRHITNSAQTEHQYEPEEIRSAFPKWSEATVKAFSGIPDDGLSATAPVQSQTPQIEAIRKALAECKTELFSVNEILVRKADWDALVDTIQSKQESTKI